MEIENLKISIFRFLLIFLWEIFGNFRSRNNIFDLDKIIFNFLLDQNFSIRSKIECQKIDASSNVSCRFLNERFPGHLDRKLYICPHSSFHIYKFQGYPERNSVCCPCPVGAFSHPHCSGSRNFHSVRNTLV